MARKSNRSVAERRLTLQACAAVAASGGSFFDSFGIEYEPGIGLAEFLRLHQWRADIRAAACATYSEACKRHAFIIRRDDESGSMRGYYLARLGGGDHGGGLTYRGETFKDADTAWSVFRTIEDLRTHPACETAPACTECGSSRVTDQGEKNGYSFYCLDCASGFNPPEAAPEAAPEASPRSIHVVGRRWFDKGPGNTYHVAVVSLDGCEVWRSPFSYGYGTAYLETAAEWLESRGTIKRERYGNGGIESLRSACARLGIELTSSDVDVSKRKDL